MSTASHSTPVPSTSSPTKVQSTPSKPKVVLHLSDCLKFLRGLNDGSVDLVLIDPPYEISRQTGFKSCVNGLDRFAISMDFGEWDHNFPEMAEVVLECYRVLRKGGTTVIFYDLWKLSLLAKYLTDAKFKQLRFLEWIKTNPVPINSRRTYLSNSREIAVSAVKGGSPTFNSKYDNGVYRAPICHEKGRFHPTQKPLGLITELIEKHSNPGDHVVDCFSGSGTTAAACVDTYRNFSGSELSSEYWEKSLVRLRSIAGERAIIEGRCS